MKTVLCHSVRKWRVLANQVTYFFKNNLDSLIKDRILILHSLATCDLLSLPHLLSPKLG